jgi:tetratricopeptide (TPR) repeat protein
MNSARHIAVVALSALVASCASTDDRGTLAQLRNVKIEIKEERVEGGIEKAIQGYERFLAETAESPLVPEAMRRLADLKVEKEYGLVGTASTPTKAQRSASTTLDSPERYDAAKARQKGAAGRAKEAASGTSESERDFETRATASAEISGVAPTGDKPLPAGADLEKAGPREAIALYKELLVKYPLYERKDQVLYHMSRAYEELGDVDEAMVVMNQLVKEYPQSKYYDEVQFRRGEYFTRRSSRRALAPRFTSWPFTSSDGLFTSRSSMRKRSRGSSAYWITSCPLASTSRTRTTTWRGNGWKTPIVSSVSAFRAQVARARSPITS